MGKVTRCTSPCALVPLFKATQHPLLCDVHLMSGAELLHLRSESFLSRLMLHLILDVSHGPGLDLKKLHEEVSGVRG